VDGTWQRHVPAKFVADALKGRSATGRWGTQNGFPVLYLGRPTDSVVVEAYRHLIDPIVDSPAPVEKGGEDSQRAKPRSTDVIPMVRGVATRKVPSELG
jgi:hypothetical protein